MLIFATAMGIEEASAKSLRLVPAWWPIAIAIATALMSAGMTYGTATYRLNELDRKALQTEQWATSVNEHIARSSENERHIKEALDEIKAKLDK